MGPRIREDKGGGMGGSPRFHGGGLCVGKRGRMWIYLVTSRMICPYKELGDALMKRIGAAKFKEQCLALLDQLDADGLVVTKRGKPVARVLPYESQEGDIIGSLRHKLKVKGDVFTTGLRWDADGQS